MNVASNLLKLTALTVIISASAACSKDQIYRSLYLTGQQYECERDRSSVDRREYSERCTSGATRADQQSYSDYKENRSQELSPDEPEKKSTSPQPDIEETFLEIEDPSSVD